MNALDLVIVLASIGAAVGGYRLGFLTRASAWLGMSAGVLAAARIAPTISGRLAGDDPNRTLLVTAVTLLSGAFLGQLGGQLIGHYLRSRAAVGRGAGVDKVAGAVSGVVVVSAAVWLLTPTMASVPSWPSRLVDGSTLAHHIDRITPDPPDPLTAASRLVGAEQWEALQSQVAGGIPTGPIPMLQLPPRELDQRVRAATVLVEHEVCRRGAQDGTGFVAAPDLVVTNAHVVAGEPDGGASVRVRTSDNRDLRARVVLFDPSGDLAVLLVEGLDIEPLPLGEKAEPNTVGWVYGHPGGNALRIRPFLAGTETNAQVPDIYDQLEVARRILPIRADLDHGDSGSALIGPDGTVIGVAFAISPDDDSLAVAIAMDSVNQAVKRAEAAGPDAPELSTGRCLPT